MAPTTPSSSSSSATLPPWSELTVLTADDDSRSPILKGALFSLQFVVTYQWVLVTLIFILSIWHHLPRRPRSHPTVSTSASSLSSSDQGEGSDTSSGSSAPKKETEPETMPLLPRPIPNTKPTAWQMARRKGRAVFMYHPTFPKVAQGYDTAAIVMLLLGVNIFYAIYNITFTRPLFYVLADRAGLLFVCNLPWLYLMAAKNQPFRLLTGTSYERLNILHRALGMWLTALAIVHAVGMVVVWYDFLLPRGLDLWWFLSQNVVWTGLVAFSSFITLSLTSTMLFRQWWYEMFLAVHVITQAGGLGFLFFHHHRTRGNVGAALFIFLVDRIIFRYCLKTRTFQADLKVMDDGNTVMVSTTWQRQASWPRSVAWLLGQNVQQGFHTSDHVFLTVPALGQKHIIQAHPFTIASAAPDDDHTQAWLSLIVRARDGFTKDLLQLARTHQSTTVRFDGPYGSTHAYDMLASSDVALIVAGGSGIAVAYPLLWRLLHRPQAAQTGVCLIWIVHDASHISWIGRERLEELQEMGLRLLLPPPTKTNGRPDMSALVRDTIYDLTGRDEQTSVSVVVSGPDAMNRTVRNTCSGLAWKGFDMHVAVEVFDW